MLVLASLTNCKSSMKIKGDTFAQSPVALDESASVVAFGLENKIPDSIQKVEIGAYKIRDGGATVNCSYETVLDLAKNKARSVGGNLIKITEHKLPSAWWSTCHQLDFTVYKIDDVSPYETQFYWTEDRVIKWRDFKDAPKLSLPFYACIYISANFNSEKLFSNKGHYTVNALFNTECSWVQPPYKSKDGLDLANAHFDLSKVYAEKIKSAFAERKIDDYNKWQLNASDIYKKLNKQFETEVYNLYTETSYGNNSSELIAWKFRIDEQLKQLNIE